jgi:hypothetical protein
MNADKSNPFDSDKPYRQQLNDLIKMYVQEKANQNENPFEDKGGLELQDDLTLDDKAARELHQELCRRSGLTADEIVADWNSRCPEDPW